MSQYYKRRFVFETRLFETFQTTLCFAFHGGSKYQILFNCLFISKKKGARLIVERRPDKPALLHFVKDTHGLGVFQTTTPLQQAGGCLPRFHDSFHGFGKIQSASVRFGTVPQSGQHFPSNSFPQD